MENIKKILSVAAASLIFMSVLPVNADEMQTPDPAESTAGSEEADFDDTDNDASDSSLEVSSEADTSDNADALGSDIDGESDADAQTAQPSAPAETREAAPESTQSANAQPAQNADTAEPAQNAEFASNRLIAISKNDAVFAGDNAVIGHYGDLYLLQYDSGEKAEEAYNNYKNQVKYIEPDVNAYSCDNQEKSEDAENLTIEEGNTPLDKAKENKPTSIKKALDSITRKASGKTVIALLDNGVHKDKQKSKNNLIDSVDLTNSKGDAENEIYKHGDSMYSTIVDEDPSASVIDVKVLNEYGNGTISSVAAGMAYAIDENVDIINLSLSAYATEENSVILKLIDEAYDKGIIVVGAAGNNGADVSKFVPGASDKAVIVNACDKDGHAYPYSNYGDTVDYSVEADSTSEAAAHMTGILSRNLRTNGDAFSKMPSNVHTPEKAADSVKNNESVDTSGEFHAAGYKTVTYSGPGGTWNGWAPDDRTVTAASCAPVEITEWAIRTYGSGNYSLSFSPSYIFCAGTSGGDTRSVSYSVYRKGGGSSSGGGSSGGGTTSHNYVSDTIYLHPNGGSVDDITADGSGILLYSGTRSGETVKYCYTHSNRDTYESGDYSTMQSGFDKITASRSGYKFDGWFTSATGGTQVTQSTRIYGTTDVYAHWQKLTFKTTVKMTDYTGANTTSAGSFTTSPADLSNELDSGTKITITVSPAPGYEVDSVTDSSSAGSNKYEYTVSKEETVDIRMKISAVPMLEKGSEFNVDLTALAGGAANIKSIVWESTAPGSVTKRDVAAKNVSADNKSTTTGPIWAWYTSDGTIHLYNASGKSKVYMNFDSSGMFKGFSSLPSIDIYDLDGTYLTDSSNLFAGCSSLTAIRLNKTFKFTNAGGGTPNQNEVTPSGLADASYPAEDGNKFWHKASEITVSTNLGKIAVSALEALDKDTIMKMGVSEAEYNKIFDSNGKVRSNYTSNYMLDMQGAIGFEHLFNQTPASMEGTWYSGKATDHRFWKVEGVANVNNMTEIHHPEAPFTTYCWAQHRGPNSGWYDRFEVTNEDEMIANLKVYHQWYQPLPKEKNSSAPMMRSFITVMYYGDITSESQITDSHIRSLWHQMTPQQRADSTFTCVQYCSDSSNYYFRSEADTGDRDGNGIQDAVEVHNWILNQSFNSIPNHDKIHFYIYLSAHKGGGEQQMGIESLQTDYYGGVEIRKVDGNGNPVQGAEFTIYDNSGKSVQTITSDADGIAEICKMDAADGLKVTGANEYYTVKETKVPKGYTGTKDVFKFKVYANTVTKVGWRNNSATQESIKFVNKTTYQDEWITLKINKVSTGGKKLISAKFNVYAEEPVYSGGSVLYQKNELVTSIVTNYDGVASVRLRNGKYRISEASAPGGYAKAADQIINTVSQSSITFTDPPKQGKYTIKAQKNLPSGFAIQKDQFSFQLWYADGTVSSTGKLNASPVKGYLTKDVNGNGLYDAGEDEFRIAAADENGVPRVNLVAGCDSNGLAAFPEMTYSSDTDSDFKGEVHYLISEVKPSGASDSKYSYDSHRESVIGTVTDGGSDTLKVMLMYQPEIPNGTETNYTAGQFNNGIKEVPPVIPDPQKKVFGGKRTITENLHNEVWQSENYQYEVSQQIPAEKQRYYFSSMHMEDTLPKGIRLNSMKVYAVKNGSKTDVTSSWKITTTGDKSKKDSQYKVSADCADKAFWNDASHYGVTYVFHFEVTETMEVHRRTSVYNHAKVDITYADPESSIVMKQKTDAKGALVKDADGNQLYVPVTSADGKVQYETENPYDNGDGLSHVGNAGVLINSGTVNENASNSYFSTKTATDKTKAVHSRTTNEVITDIDPLINLPNSGGRGAVKMAVIAAGVMLAVFFAIRHYRQSRESAK